MTLRLLLLASVFSMPDNACQAETPEVRIVYGGNESHVFRKTYENDIIVAIHYCDSPEWLVQQIDAESHFHKLSGLRELYLTGHRLTSEEMKYVASLKTVKHLTLGDMPDEIEIEPGALRQLEGMSSLESLEISDEHIPAEEVRFIERLKSLKALSLASDLGDKHLEIISRRDTLQKVSLRGEFTDASIPPLLAIPNLQSLSLKSDGLTLQGIVSIGRNRTIKELQIEIKRSGPYDHDMFLPLTTMGQLEVLSFDGPALPLSAIQRIADLRRLKWLRIPVQHNGWDGLSALRHLHELETLDLQGQGPLDGKMLQGLANHPTLSRILLSHIGDKGAVGIVKSLPKCKELVTSDKHDSEIVKYARDQLPSVTIVARR